MGQPHNLLEDQLRFSHRTRTSLVHRDEQSRSQLLNSLADQENLKKLALSIFDSDWYKNEQMEPIIESTDELVKSKRLRTGESRFKLFLDQTANRNYRCQFNTENGPCNRVEERLDRAQGHARNHFEYRPFMCNGKCARYDCTQRFYSSGQKDDHIRRSIPRRKECEICHKQISIQNVSRHMKVIHATPVSPPSPTTSDKSTRGKPY